MSARKNATQNTAGLAKEQPLLQGLLTLGLALFVLIFPYDRGLFNGYEYAFESPIYNAAIYGYVLLAATALFAYLTGWKLNNHRSVLSIAILLLPAIYWLSSMQAVSSYYAKFMTFVFFLLAALFLTSLYAAGKVQMRKWLEYGVMLSAYLIVFFGLLNLFGQQYYKDAMWLAHDGYRLSSVFQYSNTYAGFLIAIFLIAAYYAATCERWYMRLANSIMLVPILISFFLAYSRGAIVIIPVMLIVILPFLKLARQFAYVVYAGLSALLTLVILGKITANTEAISAIVQPTETKVATTISMFDKLPLQSWALLAGAALVNAGLIILIHKKLFPWIENKSERLAQRKWAFAAFPAAIIVIGLLAAVLLITSDGIRDLLPEKIASRFENINLQQHSVLERWTFYEDGLKVAKDYPLLGAGGGGWQALYEQYQNNPYWSRQAHSFFIQTLVEVGWIGFAALIGLLIYTYFLYIRSYIRHPERRGSHLIFFILATTLLLHSAIDFDMSYVYLSALLFISLGAMIAPYGKSLAFKQREENVQGRTVKWIYPTAIGVLAIVLLVGSARENSANHTFQETYNTASAGQAQLNQLLPSLDKAIKTSPDHSVFSLTKYQWLMQAYEQTQNATMKEQALQTLAAGKANDPYNRTFILAQYENFKKDGNITEMLKVLEEGISKFRWDIVLYDHAIVEYAAAMSSDAGNADTYRTRALEIKAEVERRIAQLATLPPEQSQGRDFNFTPAMQQALAAIESK
ncbi:O-antigen ligase family protein [Paenibacillus sp. FSL H8-0537]|uniref:O-antigen ligase family protein n=1 Tax=Paenibacillus sp. FSL H8-0537 TaxID=2921399 RepID=UPI003101239D